MLIKIEYNYIILNNINGCVFFFENYYSKTTILFYFDIHVV